MTGFTAINGPTANRTSELQSQIPTTASTAVRWTRSSTKNEQAKSVVSDYLGRGNPEATPQAGPLHSPGSKKTSNKIRKRNSTLATQGEAKWRKIGDVSDGMPISKPAEQKKATGTKAKDRLVNVNGTESVQTPKRLTQTCNPALSAPSELPVLNGQTQPISVFAPSTSMDALHNRSQQTSLDAIRASSGYSTTLYTGSRAPLNIQRGGKHVQPWQSHTANNDQAGAVVNTRLLRPHKAVATQEAKTGVEDSSVDGDDDDFMKAIDLAENPEATSKPICKAKQASVNEAQLPTPVNSDGLSEQPRSKRKASQREYAIAPAFDEDVIDLDDRDDAEIADLTKTVEAETAVRRPPTPPKRDRRKIIREVDKDEEYVGTLISVPENQSLGNLTVTTQDSTEKRIVRKTFPAPILDRSPIFGATNSIILRTCFRIGEALNVGSQAVRANNSVVLELYARVMSSRREPPQPRGRRKQHFVFHDLHHDNPPHLEGTLESWDQGRLWDLDSKVFLIRRDVGIMCRVVAKMKREDSKWRLEVLSLWEAAWEDVEFVAGIYAKDR